MESRLARNPGCRLKACAITPARNTHCLRDIGRQDISFHASVSLCRKPSSSQK